jgi:hypothetical protein
LNLSRSDIVSYLGVDYLVEGFIDYALADRVLRLAAMVAPDQARFLEQPPSPMADRVLILSEVENLEISTPPPGAIYHLGESYLLRLQGSADVAISGQVDGRPAGLCSIWRFRAAGDQFLQIEAWPDRVRTLAGASVHRDMLEVRTQR